MKKNLFKEEEDQTYIVAGYNYYLQYGLSVNEENIKTYLRDAI